MFNMNHQAFFYLPSLLFPKPQSQNLKQTINHKPGTRNPEPETVTSSTHTYTQTAPQAAYAYPPCSARGPVYRHG
jgi:hypothetical protein